MPTSHLAGLAGMRGAAVNDAAYNAVVIFNGNMLEEIELMSKYRWSRGDVFLFEWPCRPGTPTLAHYQ